MSGALRNLGRALAGLPFALGAFTASAVILVLSALVILFRLAKGWCVYRLEALQEARSA